MGLPDLALKLFLATHLSEAKSSANMLNQQNRKRQKIGDNMLGQVIKKIEEGKEINFKHHKTIVLWDENWHLGIVGIIASRIAERYYRPTIIISLKDGLGRGSGRSIRDFHLFDAVKKCERFLDQMDIGEKLWGPFQGVPTGEPLLWQSFGETSYRLTDLTSKNFNSQVGFWTNRLVFKGIRFPMNTVNPFVESTISMQATPNDAGNNLKLWAGLEWRPLAREHWFVNYRPFGWDIPILEWVRNYCFYIKYGNRYNLKDEIENSRDYDLVWGAQIFYEWGVELPSLDEGRPKVFADYLRQYVWGEYFGDYRVEMTNFGSEDDFDSLILNSSVILGVKLPAIPLPIPCSPWSVLRASASTFEA